MVRDDPTVLFTRTNLYMSLNYEFRQLLYIYETNNFIFETNSVNRLLNFHNKPCIQTNIGLFDNESMDDCFMDCVNNLYNQTYGCNEYREYRQYLD